MLRENSLKYSKNTINCLKYFINLTHYKIPKMTNSACGTIKK